MIRATVLVVSFALAFLVLLAPGLAQPDGTPPAGSAEGETAEDGAIPGLETFEVASADHVDGPVDYPQEPAAGGPHNPVWQNCGFYDEPVPTERVVHSQEHSAVWITFRPDLPADRLARLERLVERNDYVLVSPYPDQAEPVVASAWGAQLRLDGPDDPRLRRFVRQYAGQGPEPGAPCSTGGTSETGPLAVATPAVATPVATPAASPTGEEDA